MREKNPGFDKVKNHWLEWERIMGKKERTDLGIRVKIEKLTKEITKNQIEKIIQELTDRSINKKTSKINKNDLLQIKEKISGMSEQEKVEEFRECIDKITQKILDHGLDDKELMENISNELEKKFLDIFPHQPPSPYDRIIKWLKSPIHAGTIAVITLSVLAIVFMALPIIGNSNPIAYIDSPSPNTPSFTGSTLSLTGHGTDPNDGDTIIAYRWESNRDGLISSTNVLETSRLSAGKHELTFRVMDNRGAWSKPVTFQVEILQNNPPLAYIDSVKPEKAYEGTPITFSGHGSDPDTNDSLINYEWSINETILSNEKMFKIQSLPAGKYVIGFKVKDSHGAWSEQVSTSFEIIKNYPPKAYIDSIVPSTAIYTGTQVTFSGRGEDLDKGDYITSYEWSLNNIILSDSAVFITQTLPVGILTIQFRVRDSIGQWSDMATANIEILDHPPVALIDSIAPFNLSFFNNQLTFSGHGEDQDKNDLITSYEWSISNIKFSNSAAFSSNDIAIGSHSVTLRVMDNHGVWSEPAFSNIEIMPYTPFYVFSEKGLIVRDGTCDNGVKNCIVSNNISGGGYYAKVGGRVALNGKLDKLYDILIEQGPFAGDKKTLTIGETWSIGSGYELTVNAVDAKASPRWVWFTLKKDGAVIDDVVINQGEVYEYSKKSLAGELNIPVFITYIDSVFVGTTTDMVQLRYTWAISENPLLTIMTDVVALPVNVSIIK